MAIRKRKEQIKTEKKTGKKTSQLPSLQQLIKDSWELFNVTAFSYLKFLGLIVAFFFIWVVIGILIAVPLSFTNILSHHYAFDQLSTFPAVMLFLFIFWIVLFILSIIIISLVFPVVSILILQGKKPASILDLVSQSKKYILSYFLTMLLAAFIGFGGVVLFVLPGLLIGIFFGFVAYEVVLENQSGRAALAHSYVLVKNHFWEVIIRFFVLEVGLIIISSILTHIERGSWILILVHILFSLFSAWYARAYTYVLYKQLHERTTVPQNISLQWIWVVSGIGWVLLILLCIGLGYGASQNSWMLMHHPIHHRYIAPKNAV